MYLRGELAVFISVFWGEFLEAEFLEPEDRPMFKAGCKPIWLVRRSSWCGGKSTDQVSGGLSSRLCCQRGWGFGQVLRFHFHSFGFSFFFWKMSPVMSLPRSDGAQTFLHLPVLNCRQVWQRRACLLESMVTCVTEGFHFL